MQSPHPHSNPQPQSLECSHLSHTWTQTPPHSFLLSTPALIFNFCPVSRTPQSLHSKPEGCNQCDLCFLTLGGSFWQQQVNLPPSNRGFGCDLKCSFPLRQSSPIFCIHYPLNYVCDSGRKPSTLPPAFLRLGAWFALHSFLCLSPHAEALEPFSGPQTQPQDSSTRC